MDAIDEWVDLMAKGKANIRPSQIPWGALQAVMDQVVYGGRIDNSFDQDRLDAFSKSIFCESAYARGHLFFADA